MISQTCNEEALTEIFQCSNKSIQNSVEAYAYKSASGPNTNIHSPDGSCKCEGAFSCYGVLNISCSSIECKGSNSCSDLNPESGYITMSQSSTNWIFCTGANSCTSAVIKTQSNDAGLSCDGFLSCVNSQVRGFTQVEAYAAYALYNATIDSNDITNMRVEFKGYHAGLYAHIICRSNSQCDIYRPYYYGPEALHITCIGNCTFHESDNYATDPVIAAHIDALYHSLRDITISKNNECDNALTNTAFDGVKTPFSETNLNHKSHICCRAEASCIDGDIYNSTEAHIFIASGSLSLMNSRLYEIDSLFCNGFWSCFKSNITMIKGNVYCLGESSCEFMNINATQGNITCLGKRSCANSAIYARSDGTTHYIYFLGLQSGDSSTIYCKGNDECVVICAGNACYGLILECDGNCEVITTLNPTKTPTLHPTKTSILNSTKTPTLNPTKTSTLNPTKTPTLYPTKTPTLNPIKTPTLNPIKTPTLNPIKTPTLNPIKTPTLNPTSSHQFQISSSRETLFTSEQKQQNTKDSRKTHNNQDWWMYGFIVSVIISVILCFTICYNKRRQRNDLEDDIQILSTIQQFNNIEQNDNAPEVEMKQYKVTDEGVFGDGNNEVNVETKENPREEGRGLFVENDCAPKSTNELQNIRPDEFVITSDETCR